MSEVVIEIAFRRAAIALFLFSLFTSLGSVVLFLGYAKYGTAAAFAGTTVLISALGSLGFAFASVGGAPDA